jgi:hypothetical protein
MVAPGRRADSKDTNHHDADSTRSPHYVSLVIAEESRVASGLDDDIVVLFHGCAFFFNATREEGILYVGPG